MCDSSQQLRMRVSRYVFYINHHSIPETIDKNMVSLHHHAFALRAVPVADGVGPTELRSGPLCGSRKSGRAGYGLELRNPTLVHVHNDTCVPGRKRKTPTASVRRE